MLLLLCWWALSGSARERAAAAQQLAALPAKQCLPLPWPAAPAAPDDAPVQLLVLLHQGFVLCGIIALQQQGEAGAGGAEDGRAVSFRSGRLKDEIHQICNRLSATRALSNSIRSAAIHVQSCNFVPLVAVPWPHLLCVR